MTGGPQGIYDYWLGLLPQFLSQFGAAMPQPDAAPATAAALPFPIDQVAKAAAMTSDALQRAAQVYAPMLQAAGAPGLLAQWASAAAPMLSGAAPQPATLPPTAAMTFPWMSLPFAPAMAAAAQAAPAASAWLPLQQMQKAWAGLAAPLAGGTAQTYVTAFDRTYGALGDALGLGPMRKLQAASQDIVAATLAQQEARAGYALLVQSAMAAGLRTLLHRLAHMAQRGEHVDSVLALMRMWAVATEESVHEILQSERGLAATAAVTRAGLASRRKTQAFAAIVADAFDMATRRDLDDAYREIQGLKRELRALRMVASAASPPAAAAPPRARKTKRAKP